MINPTISEWLNLIARWIHVFAGIMWVGTTYYFTWLDARFHDEEGSAGSVDEKVEVWMVHSGGFYVVEKRKTPSLRRLHWFRWEAMLTWLSGMLMLTVVYYMGGVMVDTDVRDISVTTAVLFGLGMLTVGWIVYDLLWLWAMLLVLAAVVCRRRFIALQALGALVLATALGYLSARWATGHWPVFGSAIEGASDSPPFPAMRIAEIGAVILVVGPHLVRSLRLTGRWILLLGRGPSVSSVR